jgi:hypothetical protein
MFSGVCNGLIRGDFLSLSNFLSLCEFLSSFDFLIVLPISLPNGEGGRCQATTISRYPVPRRPQKTTWEFCHFDTAEFSMLVN